MSTRQRPLTVMLVEVKIWVHESLYECEWQDLVAIA
jgi:hypothetical protein